MRIHPRTARDGARFGQGYHRLEQHHIVQDLHHLAAADGAAIGDFVGEGGDQGLDGFEGLFVPADHDRQRAGLRRGSGAGHRGVDEGGALGRELARQFARDVHRRGAQVHDQLARARVRQQAVGGARQLGDHFARRQGQEHHVALLHDLHDGRGRHAVRCQTLQRGRVGVAAQYRQSAFDGQVAADRFAHDAQANETGALKFSHLGSLR
ncbi:hypothetical protein D9M68_813610 [compost metagenome]